MRFLLALFSLGIFSWIGYGLFTGTLPEAPFGLVQTKALMSLVQDAADRFGQDRTALASVSIGALLSTLILWRRSPG